MRKDLEFYNLIGFYQNKDYFRNKYELLKIEEKEIYKIYVYSLPYMSDNIKDLIWEYLNNWEESQEDLKLKYLEAKQRYEKRIKNATHNTNEVKLLE